MSEAFFRDTEEVFGMKSEVAGVTEGDARKYVGRAKVMKFNAGLLPKLTLKGVVAVNVAEGMNKLGPLYATEKASGEMLETPSHGSGIAAVVAVQPNEEPLEHSKVLSEVSWPHEGQET